MLSLVFCKIVLFSRFKLSQTKSGKSREFFITYFSSFIVLLLQHINGKSIHLGYFDTLEKAIKARKEAEEKYFKPILEKYKKIE